MATGDMPEETTLVAQRIEGYERLSDDEWATLLHEAVAAVERTAREEREETGRRIVGRKAILAASPTQKPTTVEPRRGLRPHIACKREELRIAALVALMEFREAYARARLAFIAGDREIVFPHGTYLLRHIAGVTVATGPPS
jgi:hypothetical protein